MSPTELPAASGANVELSALSIANPQSQSVLGTTQGFLDNAIQNRRYNPYPQLITPPWYQRQQQMMEMMQQMIQMLMEMMMRIIGLRPPTKSPFPGNQPDFIRPPGNSLLPLPPRHGVTPLPKPLPINPGFGYQLPPFMPSLPPPSPRTMIGMVQQMLEMVMRMLRDILRRPQQPPSLQPPFGLTPGNGRFDVNMLAGTHISDARRSAMQAGVSQIRVLAPDQMHTMDYQPNRLNLIVDQAGTVSRAFWG
jgi:hypothetical protein